MKFEYVVTSSYNAQPSCNNCLNYDMIYKDILLKCEQNYNRYLKESYNPLLFFIAVCAMVTRAI